MSMLLTIIVIEASRRPCCPAGAPATVVGRPSLLMLAVTWVGVAMEEVVVSRETL